MVRCPATGAKSGLLLKVIHAECEGKQEMIARLVLQPARNKIKKTIVLFVSFSFDFSTLEIFCTCVRKGQRVSNYQEESKAVKPAALQFLESLFQKVIPPKINTKLL